MKRKPQLTKIVSASAVDFGRNDGKHDSIEKYFLDTGLIDQIYQRKVSILLGRKGTGKTAVARHLVNDADKSWNKWASILSFRDVPVKLLEEFADANYSQSGRFDLLWKFIFLIELGKLVIKDETIDPDAKQKIEALILQVHPDLASSPEVYLRRTRERGFSIGTEGAKVTERTSSDGTIAKLAPYVASLNTTIKSVARLECKYTCVIDELDDSYSNSSDYFDLLIGLFKAAMDLNSGFSQEWKPLQVVVAIRDDIFRMLTYSDKNKWSDLAKNLEWIPGLRERLFDSDLFNLINLRIGASLVDEPTIDEDYWNCIFDNHAVKSDLKPFQYILSRTFYRPRDVIQFCKDIQNEAAHQKKEKFDKASILGAEESFSNWLVEELIDEMHIKLPVIRDLLEALKRHGHPTFKQEDLLASMRAVGIPQEADISGYLETLYEFSVIGQFDGDDSVPIFRYRNPMRRFERGRKYSIHYGLRSALRLFGTPSRRHSQSSQTFSRKTHGRGRSWHHGKRDI